MINNNCNPITISNCPPINDCEGCMETLKSECIMYNGITLKDALDSVTLKKSIVFEKEINTNQAKQLFTTPIEIAPAPGIGKYYRIVSAWGKYTFNTIPYSSIVCNLVVKFRGKPTSVIQFSPAFHEETSSAIYSGQNVANKLFENTALDISLSNQNLINGNGSFHLYIQVVVENL